MATHDATLKNGGVHTKILISQQQLILRGSSNKEWNFLHGLKICVRIELKVTTIIEQLLSNSEIEPIICDCSVVIATGFFCGRT